MSTNHTPNYSLSQWQASDSVIREDFNADNAKIDAALAAIDLKVPKVKGSWYWGTGEPSKYIDVGFHPCAVYVHASPHPASNSKGIFAGLAVSGSPGTITVGTTTHYVVQIMNKGFYVFEQNTGVAEANIHCNAKDVQYGYLVIGE